MIFFFNIIFYEDIYIYICRVNVTVYIICVYKLLYITQFFDRHFGSLPNICAKDLASRFIRIFLRGLSLFLLCKETNHMCLYLLIDERYCQAEPGCKSKFKTIVAYVKAYISTFVALFGHAPCRLLRLI